MFYLSITLIAIGLVLMVVVMLLSETFLWHTSERKAYIGMALWSAGAVALSIGMLLMVVAGVLGLPWGSIHLR